MLCHPDVPHRISALPDSTVFLWQHKRTKLCRLTNETASFQEKMPARGLDQRRYHISAQHALSSTLNKPSLPQRQQIGLEAQERLPYARCASIHKKARHVEYTVLGNPNLSFKNDVGGTQTASTEKRVVLGLISARKESTRYFMVYPSTTQPRPTTPLRVTQRRIWPGSRLVETTAAVAMADKTFKQQPNQPQHERRTTEHD